MPAYATGKRSGREENQPGQEPEDDRYLKLQEEIRPKDESMTSMAVKMEALMEQLRPSGGGHVPGASETINPQPESTYDPTTLLPLPQSSNHVGMTAPLRGISPRATEPLYSFSTCTSENMATNSIDPLAPHNVPQDLMMSALSSTVVAYITIWSADMYDSTKVKQSNPIVTELGRNDVPASEFQNATVQDVQRL